MMAGQTKDSDWCSTAGFAHGCTPAALTIALAIAMVIAGLHPANAQSAKQSCTIRVNSGGIIKQSFDGTTISTKNYGGRAADVDITTTNSSYRLNIEAPVGFSNAPGGASDDTQFSGSYSATGATNVFDTPAGYETKLKRGESNLAIDMTAKKFTGSFPAGQYSASMTVRCE